MPILIELKLELIEILTKAKSPSPKLSSFLRLCVEAMAKAESAADLAQSVQRLVEESLAPDWFNPWWYFSPEYELRLALLTLLSKEAYSLINLLIKTSKEDRQLINQLKREALPKERSLLTGDSSSDTYEHKLKAYQDRHEMDQRRIEALNKIVAELIEENAQLKKAAPPEPSPLGKKRTPTIFPSSNFTGSAAATSTHEKKACSETLPANTDCSI